MLIDWFTVAAQAINFLLLVWLLKRFLYRPVLAAIDEREKRIAAQLQDAEKKQADAVREQADFQHKNEEFERQRSQLLLEAANAVQAERQKLLEAARRDAESLRSKLEKSAYDELGQLSQKMGALAQQEVFSIARKALADLAGASLEERMTDAFIQRLHDLPDGQRNEFRIAPEASSRPALVSSSFELSSAQKEAVERAVKTFLGGEAGVGFEIKAGLISGIELAVNGHKVAWSIAGYLDALNDSVQVLLTPKTEPAPSVKGALPHAA